MNVEKPKDLLHVNSYFLTNRIHYNLYKRLIKINGDQFLIPVYKKFEELDEPEVSIDYIFNSFDKKIFFSKIPKVVFLFFKKKYKNIFGFHAHTLISDGLPTFLLHLIIGKPYVVSVRNTDVSLFIEGSAIFRFFANKILSHASAVFFISPALQKKIEQRFPTINNSKYHPLPNGLDEYWEINPGIIHTRAENSRVLKILFVGEIIPRKNLDILLEYVRTYDEFICELHIVGKNTSGVDFDKLNDEITNGNSIIFYGSLNKEQLREVYLKCDLFVLLSLAETFGVVYIEALSQGLPIIYTRNEGLDGFFEEGFVGYNCANNNISELHENIIKILFNYSEISTNCLQVAKKFYWDSIIQNYLLVRSKYI